MDNFEILCDNDYIILYKNNMRNNLNENLEKYIFKFNCEEDNSQESLIEIIKNNQLFDLIHNINEKIISEYKTLENNTFFIRIKEINLDEDEIDDKLNIFLCFKENNMDESNDTIKINYKNKLYDDSNKNYKQINFDDFEIKCEKMNSKLFITVNLEMKINTLNYSLIDNDSVMIVLKVLFKNLKEYLMP